MREILFRGKRVDNGEWVYGHYHSYDISCAGKTKICCTYHVIRADNVYPETVGQYTGLTDKKGEKIFEGDIVKGLFYHGQQVLGVVAFKNGAFGLEWKRKKSKEFYSFAQLCNIEYEVIGNIYDNPELLEK